MSGPAGTGWADARADAVLDALCERDGFFEHWWHDQESDVHDSVKAILADAFAESAAKDPPGGEQQ